MYTISLKNFKDIAMQICIYTYLGNHLDLDIMKKMGWQFMEIPEYFRHVELSSWKTNNIY